MKPCVIAGLVLGVLAGTGSVAGGGPRWASEAIWYQVFPERFRNGDPSNDPVPASLEGTWPYFVPAGWQVSPWTADWYELQPWERDGKGFYLHAQTRRFGGDLQGVMDKLDYLKDLGVTALYLNPVFDSPSLHKYGATLFHHIDRHFGPDPAGDGRRFAMEDPAEPSTWGWSAADRLFLRMLEEAHRRGMRVIVDGVFNHVGLRFWALQRARREGPGSRYAEWFHIEHWDDPATPADEFEVRGWSGVKDLPEFVRDGENLHPGVREHLRQVVRRWMDPNGDGDPRDGIDGWRLDVAAEVPMGFWREFRSWVKGINPEAYLTGEIWWEDYQALKLRDASPWLDQAFDGVMNYRFGDAVYQFFNQPEPVSATEFGRLVEALHRDYGYERCLRLQNLLGSHDTARIGSAVVNAGYRQDHGSGVAENRRYSVRKPNLEEKRRWKQMVLFQFVSPGAPYIYYGDEVGMWGADDPDCRKPMLWEDLKFATERGHPFDPSRPADVVAPDLDLLAFYRRTCRLRSTHAELRTGEFRLEMLDDQRRCLVLRRFFRNGPRGVLAVFNASDVTTALTAEELKLDSFAGWKDLWNDVAPLSVERMEIPARGFVILGGAGR